MKTARFITRDATGHQPGWGGSFVQGLQRHGWDATITPEAVPCDLLIMWGARRTYLANYAKQHGGEICVLERSYLGDRFHYTSVSFGGGLNGRGRFVGPFTDGSRFQTLFSHLMKPWRTTRGDYALIMEQVETDFACTNMHMPSFYQQAENALSPHIAVRRRPHPKLTPGTPAQEASRAKFTLEQDLAGADFVVTYNSNTAVDAVMAGVPAMSFDQGSMAWDVTTHTLDAKPIKPDRTAWANALAWKQWTKEEMASGYCWDCISKELVAA